MKIRLLLSLFILSTSGCASFGQLESDMNRMLGDNSKTAFDALGYPSGKQVFDNNTVYFWSSNSIGTIFLPTTSTTTGYVGNISYSGTTSYVQAMPVNYSCLIRVIANQSNRIISWDYRGNIGGCASYINRLKSYYKNKPVMQVKQVKQVKQVSTYTGSTYDNSEISLSSANTAKVLFNYARVHKHPDINSEKLMPLTEGDQLRIYRENKNWYEVGIDGADNGWVAKSWVKTGR